jgi:hypothetical protein
MAATLQKHINWQLWQLLITFNLATQRVSRPYQVALASFT